MVEMMLMHDESSIQRRQSAMSVLTHADTAQITRCLTGIVAPAHETIRAPESGLVMMQGRIGGNGAPFNLGEATVSRAAVRLESGEVGFGYTLGRDGEKARLIALCDALIQTADYAGVVEAEVIAPLRARMTSERDRRAAETAATRVDFYTLVRGGS